MTPTKQSKSKKKYWKAGGLALLFLFFDMLFGQQKGLTLNWIAYYLFLRDIL